MLRDVGDVVTITGTYRDVDGNLADPAVVQWVSPSPSGVETVLAPTNPSTGVWCVDLPLDEPETWHVRLQGAGNTVDVVEEVEIQVRHTPFETPLAVAP